MKCLKVFYLGYSFGKYSEMYKLLNLTELGVHKVVAINLLEILVTIVTTEIETL